jgi:hypothetical protein
MHMVHVACRHVAGDPTSLRLFGNCFYKTTTGWPTSPLVSSQLHLNHENTGGNMNTKGHSLHPHLSRCDDASKYCLHRPDGCSPDANFQQLQLLLSIHAWRLASTVPTLQQSKLSSTPFIPEKQKENRMWIKWCGHWESIAVTGVAGC